MDAEKYIIVRGGLQIVGSETDSVVIKPLSQNHSWCGILLDSLQSPADIRYASIEGGGVQINPEMEGAMIHARACSLAVSDTRFRDAHLGAGGIVAHEANLKLERVDLELPLESVGGETNWPDALLIFGGTTRLYDSRFAKAEGTRVSGDLVDISSASDSVIIADCVFENAGDDAIDFDYVYNSTIARTKITRATDAGFSLGHVANMRVENCIATHCGIALDAKEGSRGHIYNSIFAFSGVGLTDIQGEPEDTLIVRNCVFHGNASAVDYQDNGTIILEYCGFTNEVYPGAHNVSGDLGLTDPLDGDRCRIFWTRLVLMYPPCRTPASASPIMWISAPMKSPPIRFPLRFRQCICSRKISQIHSITKRPFDSAFPPPETSNCAFTMSAVSLCISIACRKRNPDFTRYHGMRGLPMEIR
jgi:hypothetical protein